MKIQNILIVSIIFMTILSSISLVLASPEIRWGMSEAGCPNAVNEPDNITSSSSSCDVTNYNTTDINATEFHNISFIFVFNITDLLNDDSVVGEYCFLAGGCGGGFTNFFTWNNTNTPANHLSLPANYFRFNFPTLVNLSDLDILHLRLVYTQVASPDSSAIIDAVGFEIEIACIENWVQNNSACNILDNQTILYDDLNSCGTFDDLPVDNGTIISCNFCSTTFECSVFDNSCGSSVPLLNCLDTSLINNSCCLATNLSSDCFFAGNLSFFNLVCGVLDVTLIVPTFPYVDFNTTYPMELIFTQNNITVNLTDFRLNLTDPDGNTSSFDFVLDISTQTYKLNLLFIEEGDFPFRIFALSPYDNIPAIVGTLIVRKPYFITFRAFEEKNSRFFGRSNIGTYKNKFAVLTAELRRTKKIRFDPILEHYITPLFFATSFNTSVFSATYDSGEANLKLWETGEYGFRLIDARSITFDGVFVVPNVTDTYGLNAFVGIFTFNGTNQTVEVFFDEKDTNQYRWLFNLIFVIALVLIIATSVFLFFVIPEHANISILFGLGFTTMLILFRIFIFIWRGW